MYWLAAKTLAFTGQPIARSIWRDRFIYHQTGIWMMQIYDAVTGNMGALRAVKTGDFGITEFQASDWIQYGVLITTKAPISGSSGFTYPPVTQPNGVWSVSVEVWGSVTLTFYADGTWAVTGTYNEYSAPVDYDALIVTTSGVFSSTSSAAFVSRTYDWNTHPGHTTFTDVIQYTGG